VPSDQVRAVAAAEQAIPYDVPDVQFSHRGELCSFDAFLADFALDDPALAELALIVRGADTGKPELTPQSPACLPFRSGSRPTFKTTMPCSSRAWSSTMPLRLDPQHAGQEPQRRPVQEKSMTEDTQQAPAPVTLAEAFWYWLKLGFVSFGGPTGQIAMMHQDLVERRRWISEKRFLHALNYCMLLPGPEATQTRHLYRLDECTGPGAASSPGVLFRAALDVHPDGAHLDLSGVRQVPLVAGILYGIKARGHRHRGLRRVPHRLARAQERPCCGRSAPQPSSRFSFSGSIPLYRTGGGHHRRHRRSCGPVEVRSPAAGHGAAGKSYGAAIIDDDTPTPAHARFAWPRFLGFTAAGLAIWAGAMAWLYVLQGWDGTLTQIGWFFTKAALLTFGGAYAVLPTSIREAWRPTLAHCDADDRRTRAGGDHPGR